MNILQYMNFVQGKMKPEYATSREYARLGFQNESGEFTSVPKKDIYHNKDISGRIDEILDEAGDFLFYMTQYGQLVIGNEITEAFSQSTQLFDTDWGSFQADADKAQVLDHLVRMIGYTLVAESVSLQDGVTEHFKEHLKSVYQAFVVLIGQYGFDIHQVVNHNVAKLSERHGEAYNPAHYGGVVDVNLDEIKPEGSE